MAQRAPKHLLVISKSRKAVVEKNGVRMDMSRLTDNVDRGASAQTEEELFKKIEAHAKEHGFNEMPKELLSKVKAAIKDN